MLVICNNYFDLQEDFQNLNLEDTNNPNNHKKRNKVSFPIFGINDGSTNDLEMSGTASAENEIMEDKEGLQIDMEQSLPMVSSSVRSSISPDYSTSRRSGRTSYQDGQYKT